MMMGTDESSRTERSAAENAPALTAELIRHIENLVAELGVRFEGLTGDNMLSFLVADEAKPSQREAIVNDLLSVLQNDPDPAMVELRKKISGFSVTA